MTAGEDETVMTTQCSAITPLPPEIEEIFEFLSSNNTIVFKSQQIDDPELQRCEKVEIAKEIFNRNRQIFLQRFGVYFEEKHLKSFEQHLTTAVNWTQQESVEEIQEMLLEYRSRLQTRNRDTKNRRYTAMQSLIKEGEYFSELEMMKRSPELYQELIGQYLSEDEIKQRDSYDVKNTTFSGIFMHQLEQQQKEEILQSVENKLDKQGRENEDADQQLLVDDIIPRGQNNFEVEVDSDEDEAGMDKQTEIYKCNEEYEVPTPCRLQWGNFDNEAIACSTSSSSALHKGELVKSTKKKQNVFITAGERNLLRQEFIDLMHEQFLSGKDENFDYAAVDDNTQLDDLTQINQDKEDAYFATSDEDEDTNQATQIKADSSDSDSEDELDVYMRHLNQHHSLKY